MNNNMINRVANILNNNQPVSYTDIENLTGKKKGKTLVIRLLNILEALRKDNNTVTLFETEQNTLHLDSNKVKGKLNIILDEEGILDQINLIPLVPEIKDIKELELALNKASENISLSIKGSNGESLFSLKTNKKFAVTSLIKIVVAGAIIHYCETDSLSLTSRYQIKENDLSYLSAGLSKRDVGKNLTIQEILSYLLIASDNTAMDILLSILGEEKLENYMRLILHNRRINIPLTKDILTKAWCNPNKSESSWRQDSQTTVMWHLNLDYFISLNDLNLFIDDMLGSNWLPWDDLPNETLISKGGTAPGISAEMFSDREKTGRRLIFVANNSQRFTVIESIYIYECLKAFWEKMG